jgi:hypothetical protein
MKSLYLLIAIAGAMAGGCADQPTGRAYPDGQTSAVDNEATRGIDPSIRYGSPSGRYGRPSSVSAPTKAESDVR